MRQEKLASKNIQANERAEQEPEIVARVIEVDGLDVRVAHGTIAEKEDVSCNKNGPLKYRILIAWCYLHCLECG